MRFQTVTREIPKISAARDWLPSALSRASINCFFFILDLQLVKMEKKIEAGAEFFQTQAVYDINVSGIKVPRGWIDEIGSVDARDRKKKSAVSSEISSIPRVFRLAQMYPGLDITGPEVPLKSSPFLQTQQ
jgi:hypothetical protein